MLIRNALFLLARRKGAFLFFFPILVWFVCFWDFWSGRILVNVDTNANYAVFKYFYNNFLNGVVPLWNPFTHCGIPNVMIASTGVLNPLAAGIASLHFLGMNYYQAYLLYLGAYFLLGLAGFYLLAKQIFAEKVDALLAHWLLLFSGMGAMLFNQIYLLQIFVTTVWFFYFLIRFAQGFRKADFAGMAFVLIVMCYSYLPPYVITLFCLFVPLWSCLFPSKARDFIRGFGAFVKKEKGCVLLSLLLFLTAAGAFGVSQLGHQGEGVLLLGRHAWGSAPMEKLASPRMDFSETAFFGTLGERLSGGRMFSHLDKHPYASDFFFYLPIPVYLLIGLGLFVNFDRRRFLLLVMAGGIFLLSLGGSFPLYRFLFDRIPFFSLFRNLFLFGAFLIPLVILLAVSQWRAILRSLPDNTRQRRIWLAWTGLFHLGFLSWMAFQGDVLLSSYLAVILSWALTLFAIRGFSPREGKILFAALLLICLLEPVEVFGHYRANALVFRCPLPVRHTRPLFSYSRPGSRPERPACGMFQSRGYKEYWPGMEMRDAEGVPGNSPLVISKWLCLLWRNNVPEEDFARYIRHKVRIYDHARSYANTPQDLADFRRGFRGEMDLAFIFGEPGLGDKAEADVLRFWGRPLEIGEDSEGFKVISFDVNRTAFLTNFDQEKFLVYADAYHRNWRAYVNGRPEKILRADVAFKGIWLAAGENRVVFQYAPPGGEDVYLLALAVQTLMLFYLLLLHRRGSEVY